jgi:hypothetical protein
MTIVLSLFLPPSLSHCSPSQLLFLPLLIHSLPVFASPSYTSPTCHHTTPPSYTLTTCWLAYCTNHTPLQPPSPAIPDTGTLHHNSKNTPKHTQGLQNPAAPISLPSPIHLSIPTF